MASDCLQCETRVRPRQEALQCDGCEKWQHRKCGIDITREKYRSIVKGRETLTWFCDGCTPRLVTEHAESTRLSFQLPDQSLQDEQLTQDAADQSLQDEQLTQDASNQSLQDEQLTQDAADQSDANSDQPDVHEHSFNISVPYQESSIHNENSIADDSVHDIEPTEDVLTFNIVESGTQKGKRKLVDSHGYTYNVKRQRNSTTDWQCTVRNKKVKCTAVVKQTADSFVPGKGHIHTAQPGALEDVRIKVQVKTHAKANIHRPISDIVETAMVDHAKPDLPPCSRPNQGYLVRTANRVRQHLRPAEPTDLDFELAYNFIPDDFRVKDVQVDNYRHLVFFTDDQMKVLANSKTWYLDGTFKVVHHPFIQMFSIHAFLKSGDNAKQVPLVFCRMSRRLSADYRAVLDCVVVSMPGRPAVQVAVSDHLTAIWKHIHIHHDMHTKKQLQYRVNIQDSRYVKVPAPRSVYPSAFGILECRV